MGENKFTDQVRMISYRPTGGFSLPCLYFPSDHVCGITIGPMPLIPSRSRKVGWGRTGACSSVTPDHDDPPSSHRPFQEEPEMHATAQLRVLASLAAIFRWFVAAICGRCTSLCIRCYVFGVMTCLLLVFDGTTLKDTLPRRYS